VIWAEQHRLRLEAAQVADFDISTLPVQLGMWSGADVDFDPALVGQAGALRMLSRSYENEIGRRAAVHLATYPTAEVHVPHLPAVCYAGNGWTVLKDERERDDNNRQYNFMVVEQGGARAALVYWFQMGTGIASSRDEIRKHLQTLRLQGKAWPPLVKVMIQMPITISEDDSKSTALSLGASIYEWIKNNSESKGGPPE